MQKVSQNALLRGGGGARIQPPHNTIGGLNE